MAQLTMSLFVVFVTRTLDRSWVRIPPWTRVFALSHAREMMNIRYLAYSEVLFEFKLLLAPSRSCPFLRGFL